MAVEVVKIKGGVAGLDYAEVEYWGNLPTF
jgi:hypothetical protein